MTVGLLGISAGSKRAKTPQRRLPTGSRPKRRWRGRTKRKPPPKGSSTRRGRCRGGPTSANPNPKDFLTQCTADSQITAEQKAEQKAKDSRTVFVGNVPIAAATAPKPLREHFAKYGAIESLRFRSIAFKEDEEGSKKLPRKAAFVKENFDDRRKGCNAYVVFVKEEDARTAAKEANGVIFQGNHLHTDMADNDATPDHRRSVFIGNLPFDVEEEELYECFGHCGEVSSVRVVRDRGTNIGKGIAYVAFKDRTAVSIAVGQDGQYLRNRLLRVSRCQKLDKDSSPVKSFPTGTDSGGKGKGKGKGGKGKGGKGKGGGKGENGGKGGRGAGVKKDRHRNREAAASEEGGSFMGATAKSGEIDKAYSKKAVKSLALQGIDKKNSAKKTKKARNPEKREQRRLARMTKGRKV